MIHNLFQIVWFCRWFSGKRHYSRFQGSILWSTDHGLITGLPMTITVDKSWLVSLMIPVEDNFQNDVSLLLGQMLQLRPWANYLVVVFTNNQGCRNFFKYFLWSFFFALSDILILQEVFWEEVFIQLSGLYFTAMKHWSQTDHRLCLWLPR